MSSDHASLDLLIGTGHAFAVYRLPGHPPVLYVQQQGDVETFDAYNQLNGRAGFVVAPFNCDANHPLVLIRPDKVVKGEKQIVEFLHTKQFCNALTPLPDNGGYSDKRPVALSYANLKDKPNAAYKLAFDLFHKALHAGSCDKIVLSRTMEVGLSKTYSPGKMFGAACLAYPDAFVYLCYTPITGVWMGSTPELLLSGTKGLWQTAALAGTQKLAPGSDAADVKWDPKNLREQQIVTSYLEKQLRIKDLDTTISAPYTVKAGQLVHLKTDFQFALKDKSKVGDLLDFLHPTPAVCGYPKTEAYRLILAHEGYDRSYYSGFVGPLDMDDKTHLFVNLRCARLDADGMVLYAGGGLMPDSELNSEWEETENKLQTLLSLIVNA